MARTWDDGSYKFPFMDKKACDAVYRADELVMWGMSIENAAKVAEKELGIEADVIEAYLRGSYKKHENDIDKKAKTTKKAAGAASQAAKETKKIEQNTRKTRKYKRLEGKEDYIKYFCELGAKISMLAEAFEVSETQMSSYLRDAGLKDERNKS